MTDLVTIDDTDTRIIEHLQADARATLGEIGRAVGLSAPAVKRRMDRLEAERVIVGYRAIVDHARLGRTLEALVELRFAGDSPVDAIEGIVDDVPEAGAFFTIAGDPDAVALIRARDVAHLKAVIGRLRHTGKITGTKTLIVLGSIVRPQADPRLA